MFIDHAQALQISTAKYLIKKTDCKLFAIPQNYRDVTFDKIGLWSAPHATGGQLVSNTAFNGSKTHNRFSFQHYNLTEIAIYLDGQPQHVLKPIQPNFWDHLYVHAYNSLFLGTGKMNRDKSGYVLYAFDLTADLLEDDHFNLVKHGKLRILSYVEFDNVIELDCNHNKLVYFRV